MTDHPTVPRSRRSSLAPSIRSVNFRQPTWKVKNTAPISAVSVVFAEPEQGTPLKSASRTLLSTSPVVTTSVEEETGGSLQPDSARQEIAATRSTTTSPTRPIASASNLALNSKSSLPNLPSRRAARSPSLYTSLSRSKGKMAIRQLTADQAQQPLVPVVQTIDVPRVVREDEAPVASTSTASPPDTPQSPPVVGVQPATPGLDQIEPLIHQFPYIEGTDTRVANTTTVSLPSLSIESSGKRSWYSSASSSPASSPPAPQYSPPKPPGPLPSTVSDKDILLQYSENHRTHSPPPLSPPPQISTTTSNQSLASTSSLPSSIDDRVPSLPTTPPVYLAANVPKSPPIPPSTNSLNPSSSRFTLSLPLLGRAKVPLERIKNSGKSSDSSSIMSTMTSQPASTIETATPLESFVESPLNNLSRAATPTPTQSLNDDSNVSTNPPEHRPSINPQQPEFISPTTRPISPPTSQDVSDTPTVKLPIKKVSEQTLQPAKWWDYVGWTSSSTLNSPGSGVDVELPIDHRRQNEVHQEASDAETTTPTSRPEPEGQAAAATSSIPTDRSPAELAAARVGTEPAEVTHVKEVEAMVTDSSLTSTMGDEQRTTTNETTTATWYAPWAWYSGSTTSEKVENGEGVKEEVVVEQTTVGEDPASVTVESPKVEPLIPVEDKAITPKSEEPETISNPNPISDSFEANKLGWVSFFSSKMLTMKRIGYDPDALIEDVKRDENGMEVMDIDDEEDERGRAPDLKGVGSQLNDNAPSVLPRLKSPPRESSKASSRKKVAPPLTISDDIKKETEKANARLISNASSRNSRTNTPTPSPTPSGTSTPSIDRKTGMTVTTTTSTTSKNGKVKTSVTTTKRVASPTPSKKSLAPAPPNLVLPTWQDTFLTPPRNVLPPQPEMYVDDQGVGGKLLGKTMKFVSGVLWNKDSRSGGSTLKGKERAQVNEGSSLSPTTSLLDRERQERFREFGKELPKAWSVYDDAGWDTADTLSGRPSPPSGGMPPLNTASVHDVLKGCRRVVVIGVHGWFPGTMIRTVLGEPTGTSTKFASMMEQALNEFETEHGVKLDKITSIPLEGEGVIEKRVEKLYGNLLANSGWISDLHDADAILVATHSQGSVVSTHLLDRLIQDGHIVTSQSQTLPYGSGAESFPSAIGLAEQRKPQRLCCLALCGIHLGPLRYLSSSTLVGPYIQYFESTAARELFEFQNTESQVSKNYVKALQNVLDHGTKMLYVASLNDQVVPIYSGLFTAVSHPLILRALYIDGDAYNSSDFLSNLLVLLLRILNSGIPESGLLAHLSEATAGSLSGVGHSTAYEELATYSLAVKYLFLTDSGVTSHTKITVEPFNANHEQNDYEIPWALRDIIADERVGHFFSQEVAELRDAFRNWHPKTTILRDLKRKLQPITRLPSTMSSHSKL
ncbi:hypothetical protein CPB83DRAFT_862502 [Crepidotus variabilis]|uniref:YMC020W-like alpha/beta hydrolase domain-containing protein n=1 Tax=Crepidotus variabilis TaxID=179855 RepID=A0A9P6JJX3_9AGAR|nr:hypothetical protein CPB83DRAFT_862502 [Crepidotus variabilis]